MSFKIFLCCYFVIMIFSSVCTETELYEGDKCTTKDNEPGICKTVDDCIDYFQILKARHGGSLLNNLAPCSRDSSENIFCCKSDSPPKQPTKQPSKKPKKNSRSELACQKYQRFEKKFSTKFTMCLGNNIYGGYNADINEFPHMVALGFEKDTNLLDYDFDCGGSLISEKFVLTAVHCLSKRNKFPKIVRLGKTSLNDTNTKDCHHAIDVNIVSKTLHSKYDPGSQHNDIALIELERSVEQQFARNLLPACLHHKLELINDLTVTGWGFMRNEEKEGQYRKDWLQKAENMNEVSLKSCKERFEEAGGVIVETQICITNTQFADACQGDSGGPLSYKNKKLHYIAGVVSYGNSCGGNMPGIYTRVSSYIEWIENIVWPQT